MNLNQLEKALNKIKWKIRPNSNGDYRIINHKNKEMEIKIIHLRLKNHYAFITGITPKDIIYFKDCNIFTVGNYVVKVRTKKEDIFLCFENRETINKKMDKIQLTNEQADAMLFLDSNTEIEYAVKQQILKRWKIEGYLKLTNKEKVLKEINEEIIRCNLSETKRINSCCFAGIVPR